MRNFGPELKKSDVFVQCGLDIRVTKFRILLILQNITTTLPISHPDTVSPIPKKLPNFCYPSKPHKQLTSRYKNKVKLQHLNVRSILSEEKLSNFKS